MSCYYHNFIERVYVIVGINAIASTRDKIFIMTPFERFWKLVGGTRKPNSARLVRGFKVAL